MSAMRRLTLKQIPKQAKQAEKTLNFRKAMLTVAEATLVERVGPVIEALLKNALGGYRQEEDTYQPAELVQLEGVAYDEQGNMCRNRQGDAIRIKKPAYPDVPAGTMMLVSRKVRIAAPDTKAATQLLNMALGKPREMPEKLPESTDTLSEALTSLIDRAYRSDPDENEPATENAEQ